MSENMSQNQGLKQPVRAGKVLEQEIQVEELGIWESAMARLMM